MNFFKALVKNLKTHVRVDMPGLLMLATKTVMDVEKAMRGKSGKEKRDAAIVSLKDTIVAMGVKVAPGMLESVVRTLVEAAHLNLKSSADEGASPAPVAKPKKKEK